jgi:hypothetical protein
MINNAAGGRVVPFSFATWRFGSNLILMSLLNNKWWKNNNVELISKVYLLKIL